jgi:hypothetical protein
MNRAFPLTLAALALLVAVPCGATTYTTTKTYDARSVETISVEFPCGDLRIRAVDDDEISVRMVATCRSRRERCEERIDEIRLVSRPSGGTLAFKLEGMNNSFGASRPRIDLEIGVPRSIAVRIEMGAGDLDVYSLRGDVRVEMGAGDVNLRLPEHAVGAVSVNVGVGDATLRRRHEPMDASGFISKRLRWEGDGKARVDVDLGVGDVSVALD